MSKDEEFIKAYGKCVAVAPETMVREFVSRYHEDHKDLYQEFGEYYSSIMDALCLWESAIKFAKEQA